MLTFLNASLPCDVTGILNIDICIWSNVLGDVVLIVPEGHTGFLEAAVSGIDEIECLAAHCDFGRSVIG